MSVYVLRVVTDAKSSTLIRWSAATTAADAYCSKTKTNSVAADLQSLRQTLHFINAPATIQEQKYEWPTL
jgi:hypothetical protein